MWTLIIRDTDGSWNGRGPIVETHESEIGAEQALAAYVRRNWDDEEMGHTFQEAEEGVSDAITEYFEATPGEEFTITYTPEGRSDAR
jgi:hypothetical protein